MVLNLVKSLSAYSLAGIFGAAASFFVLPIISRYLSVEDYGILSIFNAYVTISIPLIGLVAASIITIEYYKIKDPKEFASLFSSVQLIPVIPFLVFSLLTILFDKEISLLLEVPTKFSNRIFLIPLIAILSIYIEAYLAYLVIRKQAYHYLFVNVIRSIFEIVLTLIFVVYLDLGWLGRVYSWLITSVVFTIVAAVYFNLQNLLTLNLKISYFKSGILFGLPLVWHSMGKFVINQSDRVFIAKMVSVGDVGLYNIAYQLATILLIFISAFSNLYLPYLYERLSDFNKRAEVEIIQISYFFIGALIVVCFLITIGSQFLFGWFIDIKFVGSTPYIFWVTGSYVLWGANTLFSAYISYFNKNKYLGYLALLNVVTNLALNYIFIKEYGALGAAYATFVSYLINLIIIIYFANKLISISWINLSYFKKKRIS